MLEKTLSRYLDAGASHQQLQTDFNYFKFRLEELKKPLYHHLSQDIRYFEQAWVDFMAAVYAMDEYLKI